MLESIIAGDGARLIWSQSDGVGFLEVANEDVYDEAYFERYRALSQTPMAAALNDFRARLTMKHAALGVDHILDVGIGDGAFLRRLEQLQAPPSIRVSGCDVNPAGIAYLIERGQLWSLEDGADMVTFWDSLEHIRDPRPALQAARVCAIVSIPIFGSVEHVLASRHYRPDEHYWYFTRQGFLDFASRQGFYCVDVLATETAVGRDGIETFVLKRRV